jgi:hypothetical protein
MSDARRSFSLVVVLATLVALWIVMPSRAQQPVNVSQVGGLSPVAAICDDPSKIASVDINLGAGTGNTEIVALSGSTVIYVCGFLLQVGGADGTQWITGTGSACATGETDKATFKFVADGDGAVWSGGGGVIFKTAAGGALCVERTNSVALVGVVSYVQQ